MTTNKQCWAPMDSAFPRPLRGCGPLFPLAAGGRCATFGGMLVCGQPGYEDLIAGEGIAAGATETARGGGWVRVANGPGIVESDWCFAQKILAAPQEVTGESVNQLAGALMDCFLVAVKDERIDAPWPAVFTAAAGMDGLGRRVDAVEKAFVERLKKRLGRVARLASGELPRASGCKRGLWVHATDFGRFTVAREAWLGGQRRMADDPAAPSRSYLKVEEAYGILGQEPREGETVVDLGAAPGGWSYSAAQRGARAIAVDNGPLKGGALDHPRIEHRREDAFRFAPPDGERYDWLFCDLVEEPHHVMENVIRPWLEGGWCRQFVVNLKFGRVDPLALLRELRRPEGVLTRHAPGWRVRHLFHDREEVTVVGSLGELRNK
jgi:23S rRNA (cytidine2498-2'-O)-methyltransferase